MALLEYLGISRYSGVWDLDGQVKLREQSAAPSTPEANSLSIYAKDQASISALFYKNDAGVEINLSGGLTGSGTANRLAIWTGTTVLGANAALTQGRVMFPDSSGLPTGDSALVWDNSNKRIGIGAASPANQVEISGTLTDTTRGLRVTQTSVGTTAATIFLAKSRGGATLSSGDTVGNLAYLGHNGSAFSQQAGIRCITTEAWTTLAMGNKITLSTTANGATTETERFEVGPSGQWGIGGATYGSSGNLFRSGGASAAPTWGSLTIGDTIASGTAGSVLFIGAGPVLAQDNANFFWNVTTHKLGLGNVEAYSTLHVGNTTATLPADLPTFSPAPTALFCNSAIPADSGVVQVIGSSTSSSAASIAGLQIGIEQNGTDICVALDANMYIEHSAGTATKVGGGNISAGHLGNFNVTEMIGLQVSSVRLTGTGTVVTNKGLTILTSSKASGNITTNYGLYLEDQAGIGGTNYNLYSAGNGLNFFGGNVQLNNMTSGSVLFVNSSKQIAQDNANLFWDDTNNRLGVGIATPQFNFHLAGTFQIRNNNELGFERVQGDYVSNWGLKVDVSNNMTFRGEVNKTLAFSGMSFITYPANCDLALSGTGNFFVDGGAKYFTLGAAGSNWYMGAKDTYSRDGSTYGWRATVDSAAGGARTWTFYNPTIGVMAYLDAGRSILGIGNPAPPTNGTNAIVLAAGTALSSMASGSAGLYAKTVSGVTHLVAIASDGTEVQIV